MTYVSHMVQGKILKVYTSFHARGVTIQRDTTHRNHVTALFERQRSHSAQPMERDIESMLVT